MSFDEDDQQGQGGDNNAGSEDTTPEDENGGGAPGRGAGPAPKPSKPAEKEDATKRKRQEAAGQLKKAALRAAERFPYAGPILKAIRLARDIKKAKKEIAEKARRTVILSVTVTTLVLFLFLILFSAIFSGGAAEEEQMQPVSNTTEEGASLEVSIKAPPTAIANQLISYEITVTNTGTAPANIEVADAIPSNTQFNSAIPSLLPSDRKIIWNATIPPSSTNAKFYLTVKVDNIDNVYLTNIATITSTPGISKQSNCVVTQIGNPKNPPTNPGCKPVVATLGGIELPPNFKQENCVSVPAQLKETPKRDPGFPGEYCQMPPSLTGSYTYWNSLNWGAKELVGVLYTVANRWQKTFCKQKEIDDKTCKARLIINDMTAGRIPGHISHFWGVTVDLVATTDGQDCVASMIRGPRCRLGKYNPDATILLGQMLVDTGYMHEILHNAIAIRGNYIDPDTGKQKSDFVNKAIYEYAQRKYPTRFTKRYSPKMSGPGVVWWPLHEDHFHLYIDRDQKNYKYNKSFSTTFERSKLLNCRTRSLPSKICSDRGY